MYRKRENLKDTQEDKEGITWWERLLIILAIILASVIVLFVIYNIVIQHKRTKILRAAAADYR